MSSEKKHYWMAYYSRKRDGVHSEGHVILFSEQQYFNMKCLEFVKEGIPEGALIVSVSYLGEMTEEEFKGED